jgi:hypothetical protein
MMSNTTSSQENSLIINGNVSGQVGVGNGITQISNQPPVETAVDPGPRLSATQRERLTQLHRQITERFNDSELDGLSFELGLRYENLKGSTPQEKARELLRYFMRQERLDELVAALSQARPQVDWQ